jgi:hypothetical protein
LRDGKPVLVKLPAIDFVDDKADKPVAIQKFIGRRPIAAFGNSDGDLQMLQWTAAGSGAFASTSTTPTPTANGLTTAIHHRPLGQRPRRSGAARLDNMDMKSDWENIFGPKSK